MTSSSSRPRRAGPASSDSRGPGARSAAGRPASRPNSPPSGTPRSQGGAHLSARVLAEPVLYLSCPAGVEPLLLEEVRAIAGPAVRLAESRGGIEARVPVALAEGEPRWRAAIELAMQLNLESRLAQRVLWRVAEGGYREEDDLYRLARQVDWGQWISPRQTLRVDVSARRSPLRSLQFAGLRIKDAVCDQLRETAGERPNVDTRHPDLALLLFLDEARALLYVDTSGEALFKRGWRDDTGEAPLKETLAAAMLAAAGWRGRPEDGALLDPCCGAGTIPIEAAQIACDIAPGLQRRFAFEKLLPFRPHQAAWQRMRQTAKARQRPPAVPIFAGDVSFRMTDFAERNAERAGVRHAIVFKTADALQRPVPCERGVMMFNPPYGERIDTKGSARDAYRARETGGPAGREAFDASQVDTFFQQLASHWKQHYTGWTAWVLSPDMKLPSAMRFKESRRVVMFNGPIECRLFRFDIVAGSHGARRTAEAPSASPPEADAD